MKEIKHLLSETATWSTTSEFITSDGNILKAIGKSVITVLENVITNESWAQIGEIKRENKYKITAISNYEYKSESINPELGNQTGIFNVDRNSLYSKFKIENSTLNGFEIIRRENNTCYVNGALYDQDNLINTWTAIMIKESD